MKVFYCQRKCPVLEQMLLINELCFDKFFKLVCDHGKLTLCDNCQNKPVLCQTLVFALSVIVFAGLRSPLCNDCRV